MGKKKHSYKQTNSSDDDDGITGVRCPHLKQSVNLTYMKNGLKETKNYGSCMSCMQMVNSDVSLEVAVDESHSVYVCLLCGNQGCDRTSPHQHALSHYEKRKLHCCAVHYDSLQVWCYKCNDFINTTNNRTLHDCMDLIRKAISYSSNMATTKMSLSSSATAADDNTQQSSSSPSSTKIVSNAPIKSTFQFPKVKGLSNLGNTCFFNAVMQCMNQAKLFELQLKQKELHKDNSSLIAYLNEDSDDDNSRNNHCNGHGDDENGDGGDDDDDDDGVSRLKMESLSINMGVCDGLTKSLLSFYDDVKSTQAPNSSASTSTAALKGSVYSPSNLFGQLCKKAPQFKGFQQQDSHELLRYLLDVLREEEIKRAKQGILKKYEVCNKTSQSRLTDRKKKQIKAFGQAANRTTVDEVFGGYFISTVTCEKCSTPHQKYESFLDLSLPVIEEKFMSEPTASPIKKTKDIKNQNNDDDVKNDDDVRNGDGGSKVVSKHMSKKEKKIVKKAKRKINKTAIKKSGATNNTTNKQNDYKGDDDDDDDDGDKDANDDNKGDKDDDGNDNGKKNDDVIKIEKDSNSVANNNDIENSHNNDNIGHNNNNNDDDTIFNIDGKCDSTNDTIIKNGIDNAVKIDNIDNDSAAIKLDDIENDSTIKKDDISNDSAIKKDDTINGDNVCDVDDDDNLSNGSNSSFIIKKDDDNADDDDGDDDDFYCMISPIGCDDDVEGRDKFQSDFIRDLFLNHHQLANPDIYHVNDSNYSVVNDTTDTVNVNGNGKSEDNDTNDNKKGDDKNVDESSPSSSSSSSSVSSFAPKCEADAEDNSDDDDGEYENASGDSKETSPPPLLPPPQSSSLLFSLQQATTENDDVGKVVGKVKEGREAASSAVADLSGKLNELALEETLPSSPQQQQQQSPLKQQQQQQISHNINNNNSSQRYLLKNDSNHISSNNGHLINNNNNYIDNNNDDKLATQNLKIHAMRQSMTSLGHRSKCQPHECSIESCLYQFTAMEMLTGSNKYLCSHCNKGLVKKEAKKYTIANRQALIFVPPSILTLHLKRFQQTIVSLKKLSKQVTFSEILDLAPFCSSLAQNVKPNEDKVLYSLFGVVEHSGSLRSGHYTAYVKVRDDIKDTASFINNFSSVLFSPEVLVQTLLAKLENGKTKSKNTDSTNSERITDNSIPLLANGIGNKSVVGSENSPVGPYPGRWFYVSDGSVSEVKNISNVLNSQAYILFYERIL